jgi:hypothetical protein
VVHRAFSYQERGLCLHYLISPLSNLGRETLFTQIVSELQGKYLSNLPGSHLAVSSRLSLTSLCLTVTPHTRSLHVPPPIPSRCSCARRT